MMIDLNDVSMFSLNNAIKEAQEALEHLEAARQMELQVFKSYRPGHGVHLTSLAASREFHQNIPIELVAAHKHFQNVISIVAQAKAHTLRILADDFDPEDLRKADEERALAKARWDTLTPEEQEIRRQEAKELREQAAAFNTGFKAMTPRQRNDFRRAHKDSGLFSDTDEEPEEESSPNPK